MREEGAKDNERRRKGEERRSEGEERRIKAGFRGGGNIHIIILTYGSVDPLDSTAFSPSDLKASSSENPKIRFNSSKCACKY